MTLALDTNVLIDLMHGRRRQVEQRFIEAVLTSEPIVASVIVQHELEFGVLASRDPTRAAGVFADVTRHVVFEPLSREDVSMAARVRAALRRSGTPIGAYDVLIAGQALNRGWTLVTGNMREFSRIDGLLLRDWSA